MKNPLAVAAVSKILPLWASALISHRYCLDFDEEVWVGQPPNLDRGAGRQSCPKVLHADIDMLEESLDVGHICGGFHQVAQARAGGFQRGFDILTHLAKLDPHISFTNNIPLTVARKLAGNEDHALPFGYYNMRIEYMVIDNAHREGFRLDILA
jgi:hypothetical protein